MKARPLPVSWRALRRGDAGSWRALAGGLAATLLVGMLLHVLAPMLSDLTTYGFHDWDPASTYRYITVLSLKEYGEGP